VAKKSAWQRYGSIIWGMRQAGKTEAQIGIFTGVSRQRISKILKRHYGTTVMKNYMPRRRVAKMLNVDVHHLIKLEKAGILHPIFLRGSHYLYDSEEIDMARQAIKRECISCGQPLPKGAHKYCEDCRLERYRNRYKFLNEEQREHWRENSRERAIKKEAICHIQPKK